MTEPLSIASGIAGLIALSTAVLTAGYKYLSSVSSAPEDFKNLVRETASLGAVLSQLFSHSLSEETAQQNDPNLISQKNTLRDCEETLRNIESLIHDCELVSGNRSKVAVNALIWPLKHREIIKNRERLGRLCASIHTAISIESASTLRTLEHEQKGGNKIIAELERNADEIEEQKMLDWLSSLDPTAKHTATTLLKQPGTVEWFLQEQAVVDWRGNGRLFWVYGASGTGKTVLISSVINNIINSSQSETGSQTLAYHYCDFANPPTLDPAKIVGSLVRQLALQKNNISPEIRSLYHKYSGQSLQLSMLFEALDHVIKQNLETTYIIIDGLDESPNRSYLLNGIRQLCEAPDNSISLRVLLSSRPEYDIRQALSQIPSFSIEPQHNEQDMETHVRAELAKMPKLCAMPVSTQEDLISELVENAEGMFRWIQCQLDTLQKIRTPQALKHALKILPAGLDETYDRILHSINKEDHEYVIRMLQWLVGSERPLSFRELAEAIALNPDKEFLDTAERLIVPEDIFELCGSLIRIEEDQTIVLAHLSVKEYLLSSHLAGKEQRLAKFALQADLSRRHVSMCMLSYVCSIGRKVQSLQCEVLDEGEFPLISYVRDPDFSRFQDFDAMKIWMRTHLFADESKDNEWLCLIDYIKSPVPKMSNIGDAWNVQRILQCSLMCFWNGHQAQHDVPEKELKTIDSANKVADMFLHWQQAWESPQHANDVSRYYGSVYATVSPLCAAASFNFGHVLRFLLVHGPLVDGIRSFEYIGNPLLRALKHGNKEIVRTLLEFGANINIRASRDSRSTALTSASGHSTENVTYLLEECEVDTNMLDAYGRSIHYWAIHDTRISQNLRPLSACLAATRVLEEDYIDTAILYTTILKFLKNIKACSIAHHFFGYGKLGRCLFLCGTEYYGYAAVFSEQGIIRGTTIAHAYHCDICVGAFGPDIRGQRFVCLDCVEGDLCAECYSSWQKSNGEMEHCKGHTFYEIPRPCWFGFKDGVVMGDGLTLPGVVDFLEERFTKLLESVGGQTP